MSDLINKLLERGLNDRALENEITIIALKSSREKIQGFQDLLENKESDYKVRFISYLIILTYHRRRKDINLCLSLIQKYQPIFRSEFLYLHTHSIILKISEIKNDIEKSVALGRKTVAMQSDNCGALHNLAGSLFMLSQCEGIQEDKKNELLEEAKAYVFEALVLEPNYPKFHATQAKILSGMGEFRAARNSLLVAIDMENSASKDYNIRLTDYLNTRMRIDLLQTKDDLKKNIKSEIEKASADARKNNLEILSFFVAIISFTIGGISIVRNYQVVQAMQLIFVLSACLLIVISGAILVFDGINKVKRFIYSVLFSLVLLCLAYFSPSIF